MISKNPFFLGSGILNTLNEGYSWAFFRKDLTAGITVGIIALPLSMALAIASGVAPQYGLYTAMIAGAVIALLGGTRITVSGPTAAFVVLLLPVVNQFGFTGLLLITMLSGIFQCIMGLCKLGRFIQLIPYPIVVGFTAGIGVVIAFLQLKDFAGLSIDSMPENFFDKLSIIFSAMPNLSQADLIIGITCLSFLIVWPRIVSRFPGHLPAILFSVVLVSLFQYWNSDFQVSTIGSRFSFSFEGHSYQGIPPILPHFTLPWNLPGADELLSKWTSFILPAMRIAFLGAIESLLCAVIIDSLTDCQHDSDSELLAQGFGNMIAPLFGGITATSAIARSSANLRAGAVSPISTLIHSLTILLSILLLAPLMSYIPMASLAAILLMVAWHVCDVKQCLKVIKAGRALDTSLFFVCFIVTVVFDMVAAVGAGMLVYFLASRRTAVTASHG